MERKVASDYPQELLDAGVIAAGAIGATGRDAGRGSSL